MHDDQITWFRLHHAVSIFAQVVDVMQSS